MEQQNPHPLFDELRWPGPELPAVLPENWEEDQFLNNAVTVEKDKGVVTIRLQFGSNFSLSETELMYMHETDTVTVMVFERILADLKMLMAATAEKLNRAQDQNPSNQLHSPQ